MGRIPEETIERVLEKSNIVDVVSEFVPLKKSGRGYMGVCPFHGDKGPSLSVSEEKQLYHCFGCGASGNAVGFLMRIRNLEYIDAVRYLAERAGVQIESSKGDYKDSRENELRDTIFKINIEAARFFYSNLKKSSEAVEYLKKRNLDTNTINKFGIGFSVSSWDSIQSYLKSRGFSEELIYKSGLIIRSEKGYYDRFRNRVMFPVFDLKGRITGFGGRVLDDSKPKYLNSPETPVFKKGTNLYGLNLAIKQGIPENIIIVEGYMDCITLHQYGITNAVASLGTALTLEQAKLLKRYTKDILICYDADAAGQTATLRGLEILASAGCSVRIITIPKGKDPDEFIKSFGAEEFKILIKNSLPVLQYRIQRAKQGKNLKDAHQKSAFINEVAQILSTIENPIDIQVYAAKVYDETGIDVQSILEQVKKLKNLKSNNENNISHTRNNNISGNIYIAEPAYKKAERLLLNICYKNNDLFQFISSKISPDEFITDTYKTAAIYLFKNCESGEKVNPNELLAKFSDLNDINDISSIFVEEEFLDDIYKIADDFIKTIKKYNLENKISELTFEIKRYEESNDIAKSAALSQELIQLRKRLNLL